MLVLKNRNRETPLPHVTSHEMSDLKVRSIAVIIREVAGGALALALVDRFGCLRIHLAQSWSPGFLPLFFGKMVVVPWKAT